MAGGAPAEDQIEALQTLIPQRCGIYRLDRRGCGQTE